MAYVEYRVVKFSDENVEAGGPAAGDLDLLVPPLFGEHQNPADGYVLDAVGSRPAGYHDGHEMSAFEKEIWDQFWELANNPAKAQEKGIRTAHGEAPNQKLVPGKRLQGPAAGLRGPELPDRGPSEAAHRTSVVRAFKSHISSRAGCAGKHGSVPAVTSAMPEGSGGVSDDCLFAPGTPQSLGKLALYRSAVVAVGVWRKMAA